MMFNSDYMIYMVIGGLMSLIGAYVSKKLKSKFETYSRVPLSSGMSGKEVAEAMLKHYNIHDVRVLEGQGYLSDHYNPKTKTVNLSPGVFQGRNVSAAAVAAHECGHAVQHDTSYSMLQMRSALVPVVQMAASAQQFLLMAALFLMSTFPQLLLITIVAFAITTMFSLVTLPVEFDASNRALRWLEETHTTQGEEHEGAKDALKWAAMTYVAAALSALVMLLYLVFRYAGSRD